jgi:pimeloyl-ACP methyl ester carboxylesterase
MTRPGSRTRRIVAGAMLAASVALTGCARPTATPPVTPTPHLEPCSLPVPGGSELQVRCLDVAVPRDPDQPSGTSLDLHVAVVRNSGRAARRSSSDPVVVLAPIPGQAASAVVRTELLVRLNFAHDLVLVDQRGTGASHPLNCPTQDIQALLAGPERVTLLRSCGASLDVDPRLFTTRAAIADLEQVRQQLGYERWDLYGPGYGGRVALGYAAAYPDRVRTLLLDGVEPSDGAMANRSALAQAAVDASLASCRQAAGCAQAFPELASRTGRLLADLDAQPRPVVLAYSSTGAPLPLVLSGDRAREAAVFLSADPIGAATVPWLLDRAIDGDLQPLAAALPTLAEARRTLNWGATYAVRCAEDLPRAGNAAGADERAICDGWPPAIPPIEAEPASVDIPTLMLAAAGDGIASPATAQRLAAHLPRSRTLVLPRAQSIPSVDDCLARVAAAFVELGSLDRLDASCLASEPAPRFVISASGAER